MEAMLASNDEKDIFSSDEDKGVQYTGSRWLWQDCNATLVMLQKLHIKVKWIYAARNLEQYCWVPMTVLEDKNQQVKIKEEFKMKVNKTSDEKGI